MGRGRIAARARPVLSLLLLASACRGGEEVGGIPLDGPVREAAEGFALMADSALLPEAVDLVMVLADLRRDSRGTTVEKLGYRFRGAAGEAVCQIDNTAARAVCSRPFRAPEVPGATDLGPPLDLGEIRVELERAVATADDVVGPEVAEWTGPDLLLDARLDARDGRPVWTISYDLWLESGPVTTRDVRVDAVTGSASREGPGPSVDPFRAPAPPIPDASRRTRSAPPPPPPTARHRRTR